MKILLIPLTACFLILFTVKIHIVEAQEHLSSIKRQYDLDDITIDEVARINNLKDRDLIYPRTWLIIGFWDYKFLFGSIFTAILFGLIARGMDSKGLSQYHFFVLDFGVGSLVGFVLFIAGELLYFTPLQNSFLPVGGLILFLTLRNKRYDSEENKA